MNAYDVVPPHTFNASLNGVSSGLHTLERGSGGDKFLVTQDLSNNFRDIRNGVSHIRLDDNFLRTSPNWRSGFKERNIATERQNVVDCCDMVGKRYIEDYKNNMSESRLNRSMDNEVRFAQDSAVKGVNIFRQGLNPLAFSSKNRVDKFCDWIGVTDRFTGYRHNLNYTHKLNNYRSNTFVGTGNDKTEAFGSGSRFNLPKQSSSLVATTQPMDRSQTFTAPQHIERRRISPQEAAGINIHYPGISEFTDRYRKPLLPNIRNYTINPIPDFSKSGLNVLKNDVNEPISEYSKRYTWMSREPRDCKVRQ